MKKNNNNSSDSEHCFTELKNPKLKKSQYKVELSIIDGADRNQSHKLNLYIEKDFFWELSKEEFSKALKPMLGNLYDNFMSN